MDFIFLRGWRLALVRNMARSEETILPAPKIGRLFIDGLLLWCITGIYLVVPTLIIFASGSGSLGDAFEAIQFIWSYLTETSTQPVEAFMTTQVKSFIIRFAVEIIWITISAPIYRIGMIRYATTMKISSFFNIPFNAIIALRHIVTFIKMFIFNFIMLLFIALVIAISTATVILAPIAALLGLIIYYYSTGYEYGQLAQKMNKINAAN
jgi:hypothetical protein